MPRNMLHSSKQIKTRKINKDENLTVDVFRPRLGFAVNPFAPSFDHEPTVFAERPGTAKRLLPSSVSHTKVARRATAC